MRGVGQGSGRSNPIVPGARHTLRRHLSHGNFLNTSQAKFHRSRHAAHPKKTPPKHHFLNPSQANSTVPDTRPLQKTPPEHHFLNTSQANSNVPDTRATTGHRRANSMLTLPDAFRKSDLSLPDSSGTRRNLMFYMTHKSWHGWSFYFCKHDGLFTQPFGFPATTVHGRKCELMERTMF